MDFFLFFSKKNAQKFGQFEIKSYLCNRFQEATRAFSSAGLEHLPYKQRVGGSNPSTPTKDFRENSEIFFVYQSFVFSEKMRWFAAGLSRPSARICLPRLPSSSAGAFFPLFFDGNLYENSKNLVFYAIVSLFLRNVINFYDKTVSVWEIFRKFAISKCKE